MATLVPQSAQVLGTDVTMAAASAGGDKVPVGCHVIIRNGSGSSINVTIATPGNDKYGQARPDIVKAVAAGATTVFRLDQSDLGDPADSNLISLSYSAVTTVTIGVISV
jgi:hypothetical protein